MRIARAVAVAALALSALAAWGCASLEDRGVMFRDAHRRYTNLMRFNEYDRARSFVSPDSRDDFSSRTDALGDLRFSDYEIQEIDDTGETATVVVEYIGYRASSPIAVTYVEEQLWAREAGSWRVRPVLEEKRR